MITIINYGMGNLGSIVNMLKKIGSEAQICDRVEDIYKAEKLILPGVGAFDSAMNSINNVDGLKEVLDIKAQKEQIPVLGICLGMQLLTNSSEEGKCAGLGYIPGKTVRFEHSPILKVPHMGWNLVHPIKYSKLTQDLPENSRFYFVHSYYVKVDQDQHKVMTTKYGIDFDSVIQNNNVYGAQFHPEKSHSFGMKLFYNFTKI